MQTATLNSSLAELGWKNCFQQQLSLEEWEGFQPGRVIQQHKSELQVLTEDGPVIVNAPISANGGIEAVTVGDWLLLDTDKRIVRLLERASVFSRKAAGSKVEEQLIAANIDTLFIVTSLNNDFNLNRVERYLVLAHEAGVEPVVVLTKADLCQSEDFLNECIEKIQSLDGFLAVVALNALDISERTKLAPWCATGNTLALLGSSGVGKSTLVNTLLEDGVQATGGIREDDSKGHHTTTSRSLHIIPSDGAFGGIVLDTPGMREIQIANSGEGIQEAFADIIGLSQQCKFGNCEHQSEPGCAVRAAIDSGVIALRRLQSFQKLQREDERNSASLAQKRMSDKKLHKYYRSVQADNRRFKNR